MGPRIRYHESFRNYQIIYIYFFLRKIEFFKTLNLYLSISFINYIYNYTILYCYIILLLYIIIIVYHILLNYYMRRLSWMSKYNQRSPHKKIVEGSFKVGYFSHYYIGVVCLESRCIFRGPHTKFLYECRLQGWQYRLHALDKIYY